jgi:hypothetical protein
MRQGGLDGGFASRPSSQATASGETRPLAGSRAPLGLRPLSPLLQERQASDRRYHNVQAIRERRGRHDGLLRATSSKEQHKQSLDEQAVCREDKRRLEFELTWPCQRRPAEVQSSCCGKLTLHVVVLHYTGLHVADNMKAASGQDRPEAGKAAAAESRLGAPDTDLPPLPLGGAASKSAKPSSSDQLARATTGPCGAASHSTKLDSGTAPLLGAADSNPAASPSACAAGGGQSANRSEGTAQVLVCHVASLSAVIVNASQCCADAGTGEKTPSLLCCSAPGLAVEASGGKHGLSGSTPMLACAACRTSGVACAAGRACSTFCKAAVSQHCN